MQKTIPVALLILVYTSPYIFLSAGNEVLDNLAKSISTFLKAPQPEEAKNTLKEAVTTLEKANVQVAGAKGKLELDFSALADQKLYTNLEEADKKLNELLDVIDEKETKEKEPIITDHYKEILAGLQNLRKELRYRSNFDPTKEDDPIAKFFLLMAKAKDVLAISGDAAKDRLGKDIEKQIINEVYQLAQDLIVERAAGAAQLLQKGRMPRELEDILKNMKQFFVDELFDKKIKIGTKEFAFSDKLDTSTEDFLKFQGFHGFVYDPAPIQNLQAKVTQHEDAHELVEKSFKEGIIADFFEIIKKIKEALTDKDFKFNEATTQPKVNAAVKALSTVQWNCLLEFANNPQKTGAVTFKVRTPDVKMGNCDAILALLKTLSDDDSIQDILKANWKDFATKITNLTTAITQHPDAHTLKDESFEKGIISDFFNLLDKTQETLTELKIEGVAPIVNKTKWDSFLAFANNPQMVGLIPKERNPGVKIGNCDVILDKLEEYKKDTDMQKIIETQGKDFVAKITSLIPYIYRDPQSEYISFDGLEAKDEDPVYKKFDLNTCPDNTFAACKRYDLLMNFLTLAVKAKQILLWDKRTLSTFAPNLLFHFTEHFREGLLGARQNDERIKNCIAVLETLKLYREAKEIDSDDDILKETFKSQYIDRIVKDLANPAVARFAASIKSKLKGFKPKEEKISDFKKMLELTNELWPKAIDKSYTLKIYQPIVDAYNAAVKNRNKYKAAIEDAPSKAADADPKANWAQILAKTTKEDYEQSTKDAESLVSNFETFMFESGNDNIMPEDWDTYYNTLENNPKKEEYDTMEPL